MSEKEAYERVFVDFGFDWSGPLELTGKCKREKVLGKTYEYVQVQRRLFGIPMFKTWIPKENISWFDKPVVEYFDCNCEKLNK